MSFLKKLRFRMKNIIDFLIYFFGGLPIIFAVDEDDPELRDNPRKKARIRRKWRRERKKSGKKADV